MTCAASKTVLIVDDDPLVLRAVVAMLERSGFTIIQANSPKLGLELFAESPEKIDLVLTDVAMPSMSGVELIERILQIRPTARFMFMSGTASTSPIPAHFRKLVLHKPFTIEALLSTVRERLSSSSRSGSPG